MTDTFRHYVRLDRSGPRAPCIWCGIPTDITTVPPFRPDLGRVPLHLLCGVWMRDAFRLAQAGQPIPEELAAGVRRIQALPRLTA